MLASLQQMKIDMLKNYDTKQKIPEAKMQYMQQVTSEQMLPSVLWKFCRALRHKGVRRTGAGLVLWPQ